MDDLERKLEGLFGNHTGTVRDVPIESGGTEIPLAQVRMETDMLTYVTQGTSYSPRDIIGIANLRQGEPGLSMIYVTTRGAMEMIEDGLADSYDSLARFAMHPDKAYFMLTPQLFNILKDFESYSPVLKYVDLGGKNPDGQKRILVLYETPSIESFPYV